MSPFTVKESIAGSSLTFGPAHPSVEIAFKPVLGKEHSQSYELTAHLATDNEIDVAVDRLKEQLEAARATAKRMLKEYKARAGKG